VGALTHCLGGDLALTCAAPRAHPCLGSPWDSRVDMCLQVCWCVLACLIDVERAASPTTLAGGA
jgi:hypothetical protein